MACPTTHPDDAERYVRGQMPEPDQIRFEEHFFSCQDCLADVRDLQDLSDVAAVAAAAGGPAMGSTVAPTAGPRAATRHLQWTWVGLAAAASIALAVFIFREGSSPATPAATIADEASTPAPPPSPPAPPSGAGESRTVPLPSPTPPATASSPTPQDRRRQVFMQLAVITPPPYVRLPTRSAGVLSDPIDAAMSGYGERRYAQVARELTRLLPQLDGEPAQRARFYLGVVELLRGRIAEGRNALQQVVDAAVPPYSDEAHFYLAKAALAAGDEAAARRELTLAIDRDVGPDGEAARLLARIPAR